MFTFSKKRLTGGKAPSISHLTATKMYIETKLVSGDPGQRVTLYYDWFILWIGWDTVKISNATAIFIQSTKISDNHRYLKAWFSLDRSR